MRGGSIPVLVGMLWPAVFAGCTQESTGGFHDVFQQDPQSQPTAPGVAPRYGCVHHKGPLRAVWVTRFDFRTPADIRRVFDDCKSLGLNAVMFQVRGNGTVFYRSDIEPWAMEFDGRDPSFDPLAVAIQEAHARNIELHAWANVMPGWRGPKPPSDPRQLYNAHPDWFWYDQLGERQPLSHLESGRQVGWYVSVNPCLPEVRRYLVDLFAEVAQRYEIDGLHIDYMRFPNEGMPKGRDYPRDRRTVAMFREATGKTPESDPRGWATWRANQLSAIVRDTRVMLRKVRPEARLSAAVVPDPVRAMKDHFQDGESWMRNGWVDFFVPMNYTDEEDVFVRNASAWQQRAHRRAMVMGLGLYAHRNGGQAIRQLELAEQWGQGFCIFSYGFLCPPRGAAGGSPADRIQRQLRSRLLAAAPF